MGNYITTTTIYNDITSRINSTTVAPTLLGAYITDAESIVNGYLAKQYNIASLTAISPTPGLLVKATKDMTVCLVLRDNYTGDNQNISEWVEGKCTGAEELLEKIANDTIRIVTSNTAIAPTTNINMKSNMAGYPLAMNRDDPLDWAVPGTLLEEIADDREAAS